MLSKADIKLLEKQEREMRTAYYYDYKRASLVRDQDTLYDIYEKYTGNKLSRNYNCSVCLIKIYKLVGELYFKSKEYYESIKQSGKVSVRKGKDSELDPKGLG